MTSAAPSACHHGPFCLRTDCEGKVLAESAIAALERAPLVGNGDVAADDLRALINARFVYRNRGRYERTARGRNWLVMLGRLPRPTGGITLSRALAQVRAGSDTRRLWVRAGETYGRPFKAPSEIPE